MLNKINFLLNCDTKTGILFFLELSNSSKKDSLNEYYENKITIQFYESDFFFIIYRKQMFKGLLLGIPHFNLIKSKFNLLSQFSRLIDGLLVSFKKLEKFYDIDKFFLKSKNIKKKHKRYMDIDRIFCYLCDRKKKQNKVLIF